MEKNKISELVNVLEEVFENDQKYRSYFSSANNQELNFEDIKKMNVAQKKLDENNLKIIEEIINEYGWLSPDVIGSKANKTLFLVIQHADIEIQKKYYPIMENAVEKGNALMCDLALLKDRIEISEGRKQIYGTQIGYDRENNEYYIYPITDLQKIDKRRTEAGLVSISEYISQWDLNWIEEKRKLVIAENESK